MTWPVTGDYKSQEGQDQFLDRYVFEGKRNGTFCEIGANDGITFSNTWYFEKILGWTGLCIEPNPSVFEALKNNRSSTCLNLAVAETETEADFNMIISDIPGTVMLSGLVDCYEPEHAKNVEKALKKTGATTEIVKVRCRPLRNILDDAKMESIDYLSIDTEGNEDSILHNFLESGRVAQVIGVENNGQKPDKIKLLRRHGYRFLALVGQDEFYVKR